MFVWNILGEALTVEVLAAINSKEIHEGWNDTIIVFIPKVKSQEKITQYVGQLAYAMCYIK
jgi:hypothetical protein